MMDKKNSSYGCWTSPISGQSLVSSSLRLGQIQVADGSVYWTEGRPEEKGRTVLMSWSNDSEKVEVSPADMDVRTRVHEYGGGAFLISGNRRFFIHNGDQQVYESLIEGGIRQITKVPNVRFADACLDETRELLYLVSEDHTEPENVLNRIVRVTLDGSSELQIVHEGHDFYSNPRVSPDGEQFLFLAWDHPNMPWDGTRLYTGSLDPAGALDNIDAIAGGEEISIFQPQWDPNGEIYYISDETGWWNLYQHKEGEIHCLWEKSAEFGLPQWAFGMSTYAVIQSGILIATYKNNGQSHLIQIDVKKHATEELLTHYTDIDQLQGKGDWIAFVGGSAQRPRELVAMELSTLGMTAIQVAAVTNLPGDYISEAKAVEFESRQAEMGHAWYYAPINPEFRAPRGEKPPLIVLSHGGPTAYNAPAFNLAIQFWTTRGFAVVDVNYSGSTGFGRKYRERLNQNWGIRDVEDCVAAAEALVTDNLADPQRLIIKGGSAGGYTTLAALTFHDVFKAGASYYGVGDLELLARDTHKFESRYLDRLVGAYPEQRQTYLARSPINFPQRINCPMIFFQGLDDPVVPPNQAETMVNALKSQGLPVAYVAFEGESHGFRQARTIVKAIESEYAFYVRIFGMKVAGDLEALDIANFSD